MLPRFRSSVRIDPVRLDHCAAEWVRATGVSPTRAILYLHGGAFLTCGLNTHRSLVCRLSRAADAGVLTVGYRKLPSYQITDAIEDALSGLSWLQDHGFDGEQVVVAGDSAGGYLAFMTTLSAIRSHLAKPAGIATVSPFTDPDPAASSPTETRAAVRCSPAEPCRCSLGTWARCSFHRIGRNPHVGSSPRWTPTYPRYRPSPSMPVQTNCCWPTPNSWRNGSPPRESGVICTCGTARFTISRWRRTSCRKAGGPFDTSATSSKRSPTVARRARPLQQPVSAYRGFREPINSQSTSWSNSCRCGSSSSSPISAVSRAPASRRPSSREARRGPETRLGPLRQIRRRPGVENATIR
ncbi:alpha/beta hydrolase fold family protein [Mycobacterium kansasii 824]|nr:alpha/beta hydrolase fold family protein [Mycobacterium kansasii 824]